MSKVNTSKNTQKPCYILLMRVTTRMYIYSLVMLITDSNYCICNTGIIGLQSDGLLMSNNW